MDLRFNFNGKFGKVEGTDKQRYKCKSCKKTFVADKDFRKFKGNAKIVTAVIDLYFKGVSLRKIQDHMKQFYGMEITHVTIYYWIKRFTKLMIAYKEVLKPQVSGLWHIDEQAIKRIAVFLVNPSVISFGRLQNPYFRSLSFLCDRLTSLLFRRESLQFLPFPNILYPYK